MMSIEIWIQSIGAKIEKLSDYFVWVAMVMIAAMMFLDSTNAIAIKLGYGGIPSGVEMMEELMVCVVYLGIANVFFKPGHIATEVLIVRMRGHWPVIVHVLIDLILIAVISTIAWRTGVMAYGNLVLKCCRAALWPIPTYPAQIIVFLSFLLLLISVLWHLLSLVVSKKDNIAQNGG